MKKVYDDLIIINLYQQINPAYHDKTKRIC